MRSNRLPVALSAGFLALLIAALIGGERLTTPADEMRHILPYCQAVVRAQEARRWKLGSYGSLVQLEREANPLGTSLCQAAPDGYSVELTPTKVGYDFRIDPSRRDAVGAPRRLSLFVNQTGTIRFSYGSGRAGPASDPIPEYWEKRYFPHPTH